MPGTARRNLTIAALLIIAVTIPLSAAATTINVYLNNGNPTTTTVVTSNATTIYINASAGDIINISGNSGGKNVFITGATTINLAAGTSITGNVANTFNPALQVPGGSAVNGGGSNVTITGADNNIDFEDGGRGLGIPFNGSGTPFEKMPISSVFFAKNTQTQTCANPNQLMLFDL